MKKLIRSFFTSSLMEMKAKIKCATTDILGLRCLWLLAIDNINIRLLLKIGVIWLLAITNISWADDIDDIKWIAQDYPPYSYVDQDGNNAGSVIDLVGKILKKSGSTKTVQDIEIRTFSKMFVLSNNDQNTVFFPLAKTAEKKDHFKWAGPIFMDNPVIFARVSLTDEKTKATIKINIVEDLKNYSILGREKYTGVMQLQVAGISVNLGSSDQENMISLKEGKVDLVVCNKFAGLSIMKNLEMDAKDYQVVYSLDPSEMSFAFNKDTDNNIIEQIQQILKTVKLKE